MNKRRRFKQKRRRAVRGTLTTWEFAAKVQREKRAELKAQWHALAFASGPQQGAMFTRLMRTAHIYPGRGAKIMVSYAETPQIVDWKTAGTDWGTRHIYGMRAQGPWPKYPKTFYDFEGRGRKCVTGIPNKSK